MQIATQHDSHIEISGCRHNLPVVHNFCSSISASRQWKARNCLQFVIDYLMILLAWACESSPFKPLVDQALSSDMALALVRRLRIALMWQCCMQQEISVFEPSHRCRTIIIVVDPSHRHRIKSSLSILHLVIESNHRCRPWPIVIIGRGIPCSGTPGIVSQRGQRHTLQDARLRNKCPVAGCRTSWL